MKNKYLECKNNLLQARKRSGFLPKQAAFLLSKKSADELYRYETSACFPSLPTALKLEIIYRTPIRLMFQDLFDALEKEITEKRKSPGNSFPVQSELILSRADKLSMEENCFYADILKSRFPSPKEMRLITTHIINLSNTLSEYKQGRRPFPTNIFL